LDNEGVKVKEFKEYSIKEIISLIIDYRGKTPKKLGGDWSDTGYKVFSAKNIKTGKIVQKEKIKYVSNELYQKWMKEEIQKEDILLTSEAPFGEVFYWDSDEKIVIGQRLFALRINDLFYPKYIYYYLTSPFFQSELSRRATGTTVMGLRQTELLKCKIVAPSYEIQKLIADVLWTLDSKIRIDEEINNNLLEQALTLYATQFSSLELNGCIGDYCSVKSGFAFKSSWWTNSGVRVIKIGSINQDNLNLLECSYVNEDKADKAKDFVVKAGDLLIAMTGATIGKFAMVPYSSEMLLVNQRVGKFFLGNNPVEKLPFIYCTLKQPEVYGEVVNRGQGSAQPNISASDIMSIPCVIPSQDAINDFNNTSQPLFDLIISNQQENQHLSELRNTLLPKLMSGELDVSDIEI
jgi:type I restriction enzyme S subunit